MRSILSFQSVFIRFLLMAGFFYFFQRFVCLGKLALIKQEGKIEGRDILFLKPESFQSCFIRIQEPAPKVMDAYEGERTVEKSFVSFLTFFKHIFEVMPVQGHLDGCEQVFRFKWFDDIAEGFCDLCPFQCLFFRVGGQIDNGNVEARMNDCCGLDPIHFTFQHNVHQH